MKSEKEAKVKPIGLLVFFLFGCALLSGMESILLYTGATLTGFIEIDSWLSLWILSIISLGGMAVALTIDALTGTLYEKWGRQKAKIVFLFVAKVVEGLVLISIVHQGDEWLEGVTCSTWSETIIGYVIFLLLESVFAFGNKIRTSKNI